MSEAGNIIPLERIDRRVYLIRGQKVIRDTDLADLYEIPTKALKQAARRNIERFPRDFMFHLTRQEVAHLRSQIVTSNIGRGGTRYLPMAFTEQGVAMLSSVLNSPRAVQVNIAIMRVFIHLRQLLTDHAEVARKLQEHDAQIQTLFDAVQRLLTPPELSRKQIGFYVREKKATYRVA